MTAPVAMQMGIYAGKAILAKEKGVPCPPSPIATREAWQPSAGMRP